MSVAKTLDVSSHITNGESGNAVQVHKKAKAYKTMNLRTIVWLWVEQIMPKRWTRRRVCRGHHTAGGPLCDRDCPLVPREEPAGVATTPAQNQTSADDDDDWVKQANHYSQVRVSYGNKCRIINT